MKLKYRQYYFEQFILETSSLYVYKNLTSQPY